MSIPKTNTQSVEALTKGFAKSIRAHSAQSVIDRTPADSLSTMTASMFNILGCRPLSVMNHIDETYYTDLKTPQRLKETQSIGAMQAAYIELIRASPPFSDVLCNLMSEFQGRSGEGLGQFLSPPDLCDLAAEIAMARELPMLRAKAEKGETIRVADPTGSGAGSLLLGTLRGLHKHAPEVLPCVDVLGVDIDAGMMRATAVQVIYNSLIHAVPLRGVVVWRCNALTEYHKTNPAIVFRPLVAECVGGVQ